MTSQEFDFSYQVRNALNESAGNLPGPTLEKLAAARRQALARKKPDAPLCIAFPTRRVASAYSAGGWLGVHAWLGRAALALPLLALVAGLIGIYRFEQESRISEIAELDAAVLADELPLSAYLDGGFGAYLAGRGE